MALAAGYRWCEFGDGSAVLHLRYGAVASIDPHGLLRIIPTEYNPEILCKHASARQARRFLERWISARYTERWYAAIRWREKHGMRRWKPAKPDPPARPPRDLECLLHRDPGASAPVVNHRIISMKDYLSDLDEFQWSASWSN